MGNKVSAEAPNMKTHVSNGNPPPECPMHNKSTDAKNDNKVPPSECPVQNENNINPYNMVSISTNLIWFSLN